MRHFLRTAPLLRRPDATALAVAPLAFGMLVTAPPAVPGSDARQGAPSSAAPGRCRDASSRCCRGRTAGTAQPGDGTKRRVNRRAAFLIAKTDENGVDPRPNAYDTAHTGRALHGSGGAAPAVATRQTGPAPHRSQQPESNPCRSPGSPADSARTPSPRQAKISTRRGPATPVGLRPPSVPGPRHKPRGATITILGAPHKKARRQQISAFCDRHLQATWHIDSGLFPTMETGRTSDDLHQGQLGSRIEAANSRREFS